MRSLVMDHTSENFDVKGLMGRALFVCQYGKKERLISKDKPVRGDFWIKGLDYEKKDATSGVHFISGSSL